MKHIFDHEISHSLCEKYSYNCTKVDARYLDKLKQTILDVLYWEKFSTVVDFTPIFDYDVRPKTQILLLNVSVYILRS